MQGRQPLTPCVRSYISWLVENRSMVRTTHSIVSLWLLYLASAFQIIWLPTWRCLSILECSKTFPCFSLASTIMLPPSQCQGAKMQSVSLCGCKGRSSLQQIFSDYFMQAWANYGHIHIRPVVLFKQARWTCPNYIIKFNFITIKPHSFCLSL